MRLQRRGKKNYATYRVVVADRGAPVKGKFVADLGPYNPHTDAFGVKKEEALDWLSRGVQPSATVHNLLVEHGILKADKVKSWRPKVRETEESASGDAGSESDAGTGNDEAGKPVSSKSVSSDDGEATNAATETGDELADKGAEKGKPEAAEGKQEEPAASAEESDEKDEKKDA